MEIKNNQEPNLKMGETIFNQFWDLFFKPEITRRQETGELPIPAIISRMQVIFFSDGKTPLVRLNNEVVSIVKVKLKPGIKIIVGQKISEFEIEKVLKIELIEKHYKDCGHITFLYLDNKWDIFFDFRYNKAYASKHLASAKEFYESAEFSLSKGNKTALIDNLFSVAELLARTELLLIPNPDFKKKASHDSIRSRYNKWASLGNVDIKFKDTLNKLSNLRIDIRYLKKEVIISDEKCKEFFNIIKEWIDYTERLLSI